jgi:hypothetical protein
MFNVKIIKMKRNCIKFQSIFSYNIYDLNKVKLTYYIVCIINIDYYKKNKNSINEFSTLFDEKFEKQIIIYYDFN